MRVEVSTREVLLTPREFAHAIYRAQSTVVKYMNMGKIDFVQPQKWAHRRIPLYELKKFGIKFQRCRGKGRKKLDEGT